MTTMTVKTPAKGPMKMRRPTRWYFAYGSNLQLDQFFRRCKDAKRIGRCTLPDHQLFFDGVADIRRQQGAAVEGAVYEISDRDELALDKYEGYPNLYTKAEFTVTADGHARKVMTYTMLSNRIAEPSASYEQVIRDGFDDWGIPHASLDAAVAEARQKTPAPLQPVLPLAKADASWSGQAAGVPTVEQRRKVAHGLLKARAK